MTNMHNDPLEGQEPTPEETMAYITKVNLSYSIGQAFNNASPTDLRKWYVETFVLSPGNTALLPELSVPSKLRTLLTDKGWVSIEHAAIGRRLVFAMDPTLIARDPNLIEVNRWRNEDDLTDTILRLCTPWNKIRYDPEGENWYSAIRPGQWKRHGKGAPGQNMAEEWVKQWLFDLDIADHPDQYMPWRPETADDSEVDFNTTNACATELRKYRPKTQSKVKIRLALERNPIMHLDTSTLNQIRTIAPFANGALALVQWEHVDTAHQRHVIRVGDLLPLNLEYMVTNVNPLPWLDEHKRIPRAAADPLTRSGDFHELDVLEDDLLLNHCPTYWSFLTHAWPEPEERSAFLRLYGAAMYGTNLKIVAALIGEPNAGKDTVLNWLNYLMPGQVATLPFSAFTPYGDEDRGFAPLRGARVATVSGEVGEGRGSKLLAEKIKTVSSGGGKVRVAEKYEKPSDIWFDGMLLLQGNSVPQIAGGDQALYTNRLVAVEFKHPFTLVARSYEPEYRAEAPYFAQILFLNYLQYQADGGGMAGIAPPDSWRNFAKKFEDASNPHGWLEACIIPSADPTPTTQFHAALSAMVNKFGSPQPVGTHMWPKRLKSMGFKFDGPNTIRRQKWNGSAPIWSYYLTLDASRSDGMFTQHQWESILKDSAVIS